MHSFQYRDSQLFCEDVPLAQVALAHGTPVYVYSAETVRDHFRRLDQALRELDHLICFAVKANSNLAVLSVLQKAGAGFDIVSGGELYRVVAAGGDPGRCTFAGVGKTRREIENALEQGVFCLNVESEAELERINEIALARGVQAPVALRINPDVAAGAHKYVSTGTDENKFGILLEDASTLYERAATWGGLQWRGVQMHIGSQITEVGPFVAAIEKMAPLVRALKDRHRIEFFSIGGGVGIVYEASVESGDTQWWRQEAKATQHKPLTIAEYAAAVVPPLKELGLRILLEPGRLLVGNAGVLLTRVLYLKKSRSKRFAVLDAGMNDLLRPALYGSFHEVVPVREPLGQERASIDLVGPVCESGDFFAQDRLMPPVRAGDLLAVMSAGAYGFTMASNYNSRLLPAEVLVERDQARLVRRRQTYEELVQGEL